VLEQKLILFLNDLDYLLNDIKKDGLDYTYSYVADERGDYVDIELKVFTNLKEEGDTMYMDLFEKDA
tara:strand:- start:44 stop:244 length:201 start_codon:yes stop_codon:yes gene_type:complete